MISYHISLYSYSTPQNTLWESSEYDSISYSLNLNDATTFSVTFPMTSLAPVFATRNDVMVRVHRSVNGNAAPVGRTDWVLIDNIVTIVDGEPMLTYVAHHPNSILNDRLIAYPSETVYADKTEDMGSELPADQMMIAYVQENIGSLCIDTTRIIPNLSLIYSYWMQLPTESSSGFANLLSTLQSLSQIEENSERNYFAFRILNGLPFFDLYRNYSGQYRDAVFTEEYISDLTVTVSRAEEVNAVYVTGEGSGEEQLIIPMLDSSRIPHPMFRRETSVSANSSEDESLLIVEGRKALALGAPRWKLECRAIDNVGGLVYGVDYDHGDRVNVYAMGRNWLCTIYGAEVSVGTEGEDVTIYLRGESPIIFSTYTINAVSDVASIDSDGVDAATITVTLTDSTGAPAKNVMFSCVTNLGYLSASVLTTNQSGQATVLLRSVINIGTATITIIAGSDAKTFTLTVDILDVVIAGLALVNDGPKAINDIVTLTASITNGTNVVYSWQYGDGATGDANAALTSTHSYSSATTYVATVTATNSRGSVNATSNVTVTS